MKPRGPKPTYCYICQRPASLCASYTAACNRLTGAARQRAYMQGYMAKHRVEILETAARAYRRKHPSAPAYNPNWIKDAAERKSAAKSKKLNDKLMDSSDKEAD